MTEATPREVPRAIKVAIVLSGPALAALVPIAVVPALPAMAKVFAADGDGVLFAQLIQALPSALILFGAPLGAFLSERFGRRACMLTSMLVFVLCGCSGLIVSDFPLLVGLRLILGLVTGIMMGLSITFAGDYFEGDTRERILGYAAASSSVVSVVIVFAGGWLVEWFGWRAPFAFYAFGLATFAVAWRGITRI
jgi:MFS family permease